MKRIFIALIVSCFSLGAIAQLTYGPKLGINISKYGYSYKDSGSEPDVKFKMGATIGGMMNLQINSFLSFQPALSFTKKGSSYDLAKMETNESIITGYSRVRVSYLELPLNLAAGIKLGPGQIQLFAGPYIAFALAGKHKWDYEENINGNRTDHKGSEKIKFANTVPSDHNADDDIAFYQRPFDWGIDFGLGYRYNQLLFNIGFAMGLANLQPDRNVEGFDAKDFKYSNRSVFLTAAWLFGDE